MTSSHSIFQEEHAVQHWIGPPARSSVRQREFREWSHFSRRRGTNQEAGDEALSQADFELVASTGIVRMTLAYNEDKRSDTETARKPLLKAMDPRTTLRAASTARLRAW